ncbi:MAG TPA: hypothetical protein PLA68_14790 [Panacibacter sp.]|nr:hypothetical protein [Panacibacter sp.]
MKKLILTVLVTGTIVTACQKDKFNTKPTLEFKSVNSTTIGPGQQLIITLRYTDKEGDVQGYLYIQRKVDACIADTSGGAKQMPFDVPEKANSEGDIVISYSYSPDFTYPPIGEPSCPGKNDTCIYRFALKDKAGNISDTLTIPPIVILKR